MGIQGTTQDGEYETFLPGDGGDLVLGAELQGKFGKRPDGMT